MAQRLRSMKVAPARQQTNQIPRIPRLIWAFWLWDPHQIQRFELFPRFGWNHRMQKFRRPLGSRQWNQTFVHHLKIIEHC